MSGVASAQEWHPRAGQVVLATGKINRVRLARRTKVIGYTRPGGEGLLGWRRAGPGSRVQLLRYA